MNKMFQQPQAAYGFAAAAAERSMQSKEEMKRPSRKQLVGCGGCLVATVALCVLTPLGMIPIGIYFGFMQHHRLNHAIRSELPQIADACLAARQYVTNSSKVILRGNDSRMPEIIRKTKCRSLAIGRDQIYMEFHGGFDHFGLRLEQTGNSNVWQVSRYWEGGSLPLITVTN